MFKVLNCKLYNEYYPIKNNEDKKLFLDKNYYEIFRKIKEIHLMTMNEIKEKKRGYLKKIKIPITFLGEPKYKNILHNKKTLLKMINDNEIKYLKEKLFNLDSLLDKFSNKRYDNINIDELNKILALINRERHKTILILFMMIILITILIFLM